MSDDKEGGGIRKRMRMIMMKRMLITMVMMIMIMIMIMAMEMMMRVMIKHTSLFDESDCSLKVFSHLTASHQHWKSASGSENCHY